MPRPRGYIPRPPPEPKPPPGPLGKPFTKGVDPRRGNQGVGLANIRDRFADDSPVHDTEPLPPSFAHACDKLAYTHVLPGIIACLEQKVGSPGWRWAAEAVLKYSQRPVGPDKGGKKEKSVALPADVQDAVRKALHDPGVRDWLASQPDVLDELRQLPEFSAPDPLPDAPPLLGDDLDDEPPEVETAPSPPPGEN